MAEKQNSLKLNNRFTFQEEEETSLNTNYLMQVEDHGIFGMFMIGKRNIFKLGKARKVQRGTASLENFSAPKFSLDLSNKFEEWMNQMMLQ